MNGYKIRTEYIPACYELRVTRTGVCLDMHEEMVDFLGDTLKDDSPVLKSIKEDKGWNFLSITRGDNFGFDGVLIKKRDKKRKKWINITFDSFSRDDMYKISYSLGIFFSAMCLFEGNTGYSRQQLMLIDNFFVIPGLGGAGFCAFFSAHLIKWLKEKLVEKNGDTNLGEKISLSMRNRYFCMDPGSKKYFHRDGFRTLFRSPAWISLNCPGDACDLSPECFHDGSDGEGYTMVPHNVDNVFQQFSLLSGLAKIHMLARKDGF
ncbi:MAG: hypothetical protein UR69_C0003G0075 [Candidatus Moranbacteria bacterium GW2011_GWE2_35_2-]|nr:MAG: hypothetical protein UR69_C0003G0075 [Candidatus Moranbacteria bacterium GW2011_GWE2_35_2-]KKQ06897.1 MAG: hypothetical protein US15_C0001G0004 [Candidatus Moranbacteria bacterium GW2011_GWF1_36_4]KKQ22093.1 MAG: hypothetical protein US37_C0004G0052 [Candidatus Moranbacteria bacterium GW2011_GWF2_37_11]KKQ29154.1 MAG: hypothetical protein US44_C0003G0066 [Candidatus Moranbacteria bacterium GW2011_GWD1_37_17]KKQ31139.1 MAG: hypothetical protein US47_C0001G0372 [Candidatus Moranbacteria b